MKGIYIWQWTHCNTDEIMVKLLKASSHIAYSATSDVEFLRLVQKDFTV